MAHINLLPWREELRRERQRQFAVVSLGSMVLMGLIILLVHLNIGGRISAQEARNRYLDDEIQKVEKQIKEIRSLEAEKDRLLARMEIIQRLQSSRSEVVHVLDELVRTLPDGVYLTSFKQSGTKLSLSGVAQSNARVSAFMRNLDASSWLGNPRLQVIQAQGAKKGVDTGSSFSLVVDQVSRRGEATQQAKR